MSALARYFKQTGHTVSGYDRTESPLTRQLEEEGIAVHYQDDPSCIPANVDLAIYTPAVPADTAELQAIRERGITLKKRAEVLGELTRHHKCIAVAGSHGKTTTSSMIAHLLSHSDCGCTALLGGISKNFNSNVHIDMKSEYMVVEADEYDRSFLQLHPYYSVITATDPDHLDIYGSHRNMLDAYAQYANQTLPEGKLFVKQGIGYIDGEEHEHEETSSGCFDSEAENRHHHEHNEEHEHEHEHDHSHCGLTIGSEITVENYTAHGIEADYYPWNVRNYGGNIFFDMRTPKGVLYDLELPNSCLYNVENAVAACAVALSCGLTEYQLRAGLKNFEGIRRRFDYRIKNKSIIYIDDYAHHPQEIEALIDSVRYLYPGKRVVGIFQPHLYSRTRDLADGFASALSGLDEIILLPIYPAREKPLPGVSSAMIMHKIKTMNRYLCTPEQVPELVEALCPDIVLTIGAGDIDRLVPKLEEYLLKF